MPFSNLATYVLLALFGCLGLWLGNSGFAADWRMDTNPSFAVGICVVITAFSATALVFTISLMVSKHVDPLYPKSQDPWEDFYANVGVKLQIGFNL